MKKFDFLPHCIRCGNWCCISETPFASDEELARLGVEKIGRKDDGSCVFLDGSGSCSKYSNRPFECRIFPFDIMRIKGRLHWIIWEVCPVHSLLDHEEYIDGMEQRLSKDWPLDYIEQYAAYHKQNQPNKYSREKYKVIREVRWPAAHPNVKV